MATYKSKRMRKKAKRRDLYQSKEFWNEYLKNQLFNVVQSYMEDNDLNQNDLAHLLGHSKGYVSQVLNGDSDHRLSKLVSLSLAVGKAPYIYFRDMDKVLQDNDSGNSVLMDFAKLEEKAERCDILDATSLPQRFYGGEIADSSELFFTNKGPKLGLSELWLNAISATDYFRGQEQNQEEEYSDTTYSMSDAA